MLAASHAPAAAAVALCQPLLIGEPAEAATEPDARRAALADWTVRAKAIGVEYTRWQLAWNHRLSCATVPTGQVRCIASGRPCRISHAPPPTGTPRLKPGGSVP